MILFYLRLLTHLNVRCDIATQKEKYRGANVIKIVHRNSIKTAESPVARSRCALKCARIGLPFDRAHDTYRYLIVRSMKRHGASWRSFPAYVSRPRTVEVVSCHALFRSNKKCFSRRDGRNNLVVSPSTNSCCA